jgi:pseudaminic acid cytidylyltransferase
VNGVKPFAMIPARAGSKRCPGKNINLFCGKSLLQRAIELAKGSKLFDTVVVSSEDIGILSLAARYGAYALHRPPLFAVDYADTEAVMNHAINMFPEYSTLCVLYCQSGAFITPEILQESYARFNGKNPLVSWVEGGRDAGQFYWINTLQFQRRWIEGIELLDHGIEKFTLRAEQVHDINTREDWKMAEEKYRRMHG